MVRKGCKLLFVILLPKNSNSDTRIRWCPTEVYNRPDGLNLDTSLQHLTAPRLFTELSSCPKHFMYIMSVKSLDHPDSTHYCICFIQKQKLELRAG